jgi:TRAP-type C4-dicarboxylate transport system permease small subunit
MKSLVLANYRPVQLGIFDNLFNSAKETGNSVLQFILWLIGGFLVIIALFALAYAGWLLFRKKYKEAFGKLGIAILLAVFAGLGAGFLFIYANYVGQSTGTNQQNSNNQVTNTFKGQ